MTAWLKRSFVITALFSLIGSTFAPAGLAHSNNVRDFSDRPSVNFAQNEWFSPPDYVDLNTYDNSEDLPVYLDDEINCEDLINPDDVPECAVAYNPEEDPTAVEDPEIIDDDTAVVDPFLNDDSEQTDGSEDVAPADDSDQADVTGDQLSSLIESAKSLSSAEIIGRLIMHGYSAEQIIGIFTALADESQATNEDPTTYDDQATYDDQTTYDDQANDAIDSEVTSEEASDYSDSLMANLYSSNSDQSALTSLLEQLSQVYAKNGNYDNVVKVQKHVLSENPAYTTAYAQLTAAYQKLGDHSFKLFVNGKQTKLDAKPVEVSGRKLLPFRPISESLDAEVNWNPDTQTVTMKRNGITVRMVIGQRTAYINKKAVALDVAPMVKDGFTVVPVRFIGESLQSEVQWNQSANAVIIYNKNA